MDIETAPTPLEDSIQPEEEDGTINEPTLEPEENQPEPNAVESKQDDTTAAAGASTSKPKKAKPPVKLDREPGKSSLPFTRVQKIIKADKDIPILARDATFLISLATEEFIKRLCQEGHRIAERDKRTTLQHKDLATIVRKADEFLFLEEIISTHAPDQTKRKPNALKEKEKQTAKEGTGPLHDHFAASIEKAGTPEVDAQEIVANEDEAMDVDPKPQPIQTTEG